MDLTNEAAVGGSEATSIVVAPAPTNETPLGAREAARNLFTWRHDRAKLTWHPNSVGVARSGELGYTSGTYELSFKDASGKTIADKGKYLIVWKKHPDGTWKVLFDMSNSDLPPASPL